MPAGGRLRTHGIAGVGVVKILEAVFRTNPAYEPVSIERLREDQRGMIAVAPGNRQFHAILCPRNGDASLTTKGLDAPTFRLLATLQTPGRLPEPAREDSGATETALWRLVLDGVLQILVEGSFVSGPEAAAALGLSRDQDAPSDTDGVINRLSEEALRYGWAMAGIDDPAMLSARLYFYNREPATPVLVSVLGRVASVRDWLGISTAVPRGWSRGSRPGGADAWLSWKRKRRRERGKTPYKLYVSPIAEELPTVFREAVDVFDRVGAQQFKVGGDLHSVLRPDKLIGYFSEQDMLEQAADALLDRVSGVAAQGVPFTAERGGRGLLSWGVDPPRSSRALHWQERESWRLWVTNRLAVAMLMCRGSSAPAPWRFAVDRLRLEGVDTTTWAPLTGNSSDAQSTDLEATDARHA